MSSKFDYLDNNWDLTTLPQWGPYAQKLFGLSHIADPENGIRLDITIVPGLYRRKFFLPDMLHESSGWPDSAVADLKNYSYFQKLADDGNISCRTSYLELEKDLYLIRNCVKNHTDEHLELTFSTLATIAAPAAMACCAPQDVCWIDALDYHTLNYACQRRDRHLVYCGGRRGEEKRVPDAVNGVCLGQPFYDRNLPCFGENHGDRVMYQITGTAAGKNCFLYMRAKLPAGQTLQLQIKTDSGMTDKNLTGSGAFELYDLGKLPDNLNSFELFSGGIAGGLRIDGLLIVPEKYTGMQPGKWFTPLKSTCKLSFDSAPAEKQLKLHLITPAEQQNYLIKTLSFTDTTLRSYHTADPGELFRNNGGMRNKNYPPAGYIFDADEPLCCEILATAAAIPARSQKIFYTLVVDIRKNSAEKIHYWENISRLEQYFLQSDSAGDLPQQNCRGALFRHSIELLKAALMTNVSFPLRLKQKFIRAYVPDKYYNAVYCWDAGITGLALSESSAIMASENLNSVLTMPDDDECAFILQGTPVPVQAYLYMQLWNRYHDRAMLEYFYPKLQHYYNFITGKTAGSTFRQFSSGILSSFDYFYNSGGWDDYPPQWRIFQEKSYHIAPVIVTSHAIRFGKILAGAAELLGKYSDQTEYKSDCQDLTEALQKYAFDPQCGFFSYCEHNPDGSFKNIYLHPESQTNYNLGMDGASPLLAGVCSENQQKHLFDFLASPEHFWSNAGMLAVDKSAPYFQTDGYWNGCVWMPYQWFFWKAALDHGHSKFARRIAMTALKIWQKNTDATGYCFEHFSPEGQGGGCFHFGALSSVLVNFYNACFEPGHLEGGFDCWIDHVVRYRTDHLQANLRLRGNFTSTLIYVPENPENEFEAFFNGQKLTGERTPEKNLELLLPPDSAGILEIRPR